MHISSGRLRSGWALSFYSAVSGSWSDATVDQSRRRPGESVEEELARAIGSTIDDLRSERDARRAVIAAYANMERILASHGLARSCAEVPYEYLARVLRVLQVSESSVRSLTELFEYAKFSPHEIDETMKERAIESLVAVKEDLRAETGARGMNWIARRAIKVGLVFSAAIGIAAFAVSGLRDALLEVYLLGIGGVLLLALVRTTSESEARRPAGRTSIEPLPTWAAATPPIRASSRLVHDVQQSVASSFHLHMRLRPILREIAAHRLSMRFGVDLDREPERARELIGVEAWELVRPERPPPSDRLASGPARVCISVRSSKSWKGSEGC